MHTDYDVLFGKKLFETKIESEKTLHKRGEGNPQKCGFTWGQEGQDDLNRPYVIIQ